MKVAIVLMLAVFGMATSAHLDAKKRDLLLNRIADMLEGQGMEERGMPYRGGKEDNRNEEKRNDMDYMYQTNSTTGMNMTSSPYNPYQTSPPYNPYQTSPPYNPYQTSPPYGYTTQSTGIDMQALLRQFMECAGPIIFQSLGMLGKK